jgi:hypothetical protein
VFAAQDACAHAPQQAGHRRVVLQGQRGEPADTFVPGPVGQPGQQFRAKATALPGVDDRDGDVGGLRVCGIPDVACYAHTPPVSPVHCADRLVIMVIDLGQIAQLRRG